MISANIVLKWYYWVYVIVGYFIDFVVEQNKYQKSQIFSFAHNSAKQIYQKYRFQIRNIVSVSKNNRSAVDFGTNFGHQATTICNPNINRKVLKSICNKIFLLLVVSMILKKNNKLNLKQVSNEMFIDWVKHYISFYGKSLFLLVILLHCNLSMSQTAYVQKSIYVPYPVIGWTFQHSTVQPRFVSQNAVCTQAGSEAAKGQKRLKIKGIVKLFHCIN